MGTHQLDKNGNITDDNKRELKYDAFNRVKEMIRKSEEITVGEYTYDTMNRRFRKVVSNSVIEVNDTNGTTEYFYKNWHVVEEQDGSDNLLRQSVYGSYIDKQFTLGEDCCESQRRFRRQSHLLSLKHAILEVCHEGRGGRDRRSLSV